MFVFFVVLAVCFVVEALVTGFTSLPLAGLACSAFTGLAFSCFTFLGFSYFTFTGFLALTAAPAGFTKALLRFVATCSATSEFGVDTIDWPATVTVPPL